MNTEERARAEIQKLEASKAGKPMNAVCDHCNGPCNYEPPADSFPQCVDCGSESIAEFWSHEEDNHQ